jgi:hypothetical protein
VTRLALLLALIAGPALAEDAAPYPGLDEVMQGATAMTTVADAFVFVAKPDGGWVCAINISSNYFVALRTGDDVVSDQTVPSTLCVPATQFKNAME